MNAANELQFRLSLNIRQEQKEIKALLADVNLRLSTGLVAPASGPIRPVLDFVERYGASLQFETVQELSDMNAKLVDTTMANDAVSELLVLVRSSMITGVHF